MNNKRNPSIGESRISNRTVPHRSARGGIESLLIESPKRTPEAQRGWSGFFPYYAGYPESFARSVLASARLPKGAQVLDPWNGSGTTTFSASQLGVMSQGFDINPVMLIVARARLLPRSEADSLEPLGRKIVKGLRGNLSLVRADDPLLAWFTLSTAALIRALERRICEHLVGEMVVSASGVKLENISGLAAAFYVALFSICRKLAATYQSSNPTWLRKPRENERAVEADRGDVLMMFIGNVRAMADTLSGTPARTIEPSDVDLSIADTVSLKLGKCTTDFILTSPPYCTRIDYAAATRIELALLYPLLAMSMEDLGRRMIGSTRVPKAEINLNEKWGPTCMRFLDAVKAHPSKASAGYYYKTHLDYFEKMYSSLVVLGDALKDGGRAVFVVQDSYYKDVHNDLPTIIGEMGVAAGVRLTRRVDFHINRTMAGVNARSKTYRHASSATESVLCFQKV